MAGRELQGDFRARGSGAHHQHIAVGDVRRAAVLRAVELADRSVQSGGGVRKAGECVGPGGDDDVPRPHGAGRRFDGEPRVGRGDAGDADARPHRQAETRRVAFEVGGELVLAREGVPRRGEGEAGEAVVLGGGEQPQRVPAAAPDIAHPRAALEDLEPQPGAGEVVAGGEAGLSRADHDGIQRLAVLVHGGLLAESISLVTRIPF
ncbi:hypothetical protein ASE96_01070 [Arthrobacter sp. Leaf69]|nr:hypothetical protein ASE96_01070 [Arthrobacter sp. Leaf69]